MLTCFDAMMQNDGREIFVLDKLNIRQFFDNTCVVPQQPGQSRQTDQFIVVIW